MSQAAKDDRRSLRSLVRRDIRILDPLRRLAEHATGFRPGCRHPESFIELADRNDDKERSHFYGGVTERQRRILSAGVPHQEFVDRWSARGTDREITISPAQFASAQGVFVRMQNERSEAV